MKEQQPRKVVILELRAVDRNTRELIHKEQVAVIFPRGDSIFMGGRTFTSVREPETIGYFLRQSAMNNRIHPNAFNQGKRPPDELYWLRVSLLQRTYNLETQYLRTMEFEDQASCKGYLDSVDPDLTGPLFEGRYN